MADEKPSTSLPKCSIERKGKVFQNPFPEFKFMSFTELLRFRLWETNNTSLPSSKDTLDETLPYSNNFAEVNESHSNLVSWIGHATCLLKISGIFVLTDPIFSQNCSPIQLNVSNGLRRFRQPGLQLSEIPHVDAIAISHNHYDHLDYHSVIDINKKFPEAQWFVPLGLKSWFVSSGLSETRVCELNWWKESEHTFSSGQKLTFTCLPAQHWTLRNGMDKNHTLWCGWGIKSEDKNVYFAGDTGYNTTIFNQIGEHCGPFDLSLIPIGAYEPRNLLKCQHVNPAEAVKVHKEVKSKFSLGIHWGTFMLGYENYLAPKTELSAALQEEGVDEREFVVFKHGETGPF